MGSDDAAPVMVAAVDNDRMALLAMKGLLPQLLPDSRWLWGVETADDAVRLALSPQTRPRLLLVDMSLDDATGVTVCRRIRMRTNRVLLLAVTAFSTATYAHRVAEAGAQGIVSKADVPQLAMALRVVAEGGVYDPAAHSGEPGFHTADAAHRLLATVGEGPSASDVPLPDPNAPRLGAKEADTLRLLSQGMSYEQIAGQWGVRSSTVRTHAHRAVDKLGANSLAHAIALYLAQQSKS